MATLLVAKLASEHETDPEIARSSVANARDLADDIVFRHGGMFVAALGGDRAWVFGVPLIREDDVLRALRAADEMRIALEASGSARARSIDRPNRCRHRGGDRRVGERSVRRSPQSSDRAGPDGRGRRDPRRRRDAQPGLQRDPRRTGARRSRLANGRSGGAAPGRDRDRQCDGRPRGGARARTGRVHADAPHGRGEPPDRGRGSGHWQIAARPGARASAVLGGDRARRALPLLRRGHRVLAAARGVHPDRPRGVARGHSPAARRRRRRRRGRGHRRRGARARPGGERRRAGPLGLPPHTRGVGRRRPTPDGARRRPLGRPAAARSRRLSGRLAARAGDDRVHGAARVARRAAAVGRWARASQLGRARAPGRGVRAAAARQSARGPAAQPGTARPDSPDRRGQPPVRGAASPDERRGSGLGP